MIEKKTCDRIKRSVIEKHTYKSNKEKTIKDEQSSAQYSFIGEVSDPFSSPRITKGLVEFSVRATKTGPFIPEKGTELIDQDGHSYPVTIRSVGHITPDLAANKWQPGDFLIRVEGISMDQALHMKQIRQAQ